MSDFKKLLALALDAGNSTAERISSLRDLKPFLREEEVVHSLAERLGMETSVEMRRALMDALVAVDLTRLKDRNAYLEAFARVAAMEPERDLRLSAVRRLAELAPDQEAVQALLHASLEFDLDEEIQAACLKGLTSCAKLSGETAEFLADFAIRAPQSLRMPLVALLVQLATGPADRGLVALLRPWELPVVKSAVLDALAKRPSLSPEAAQAIFVFSTGEPDAALRGRAIELVTDLRRVAPEVFDHIMEYVARLPDRAGMLAALRNRLSSQPGLVERLAGLFEATKATGLKLAILELLGEAEVPALWAKALRDPSPWVRSAAIGLAAGRLPQHPRELEPAFIEAVRAEPVAELRMRQAKVLIGLRHKSPEVERAMMDRLSEEGDPRIGGLLAVAVAGIPVTDANRAPILKAYRRILLDPYADPAVVRPVTDRLRAFAYRNEPELVRCLVDLLERATTIEEVDDLHAHLRRLQPDLKPLADLITTLLYRFIHHYPREPLDKWVREIYEAAKQDDTFRARIPWIVRLTGATWALDAAGPREQGSAFLDTMMDALKGRGGYRGASNLLRDAWTNRTLKKNDATALYRRLLHTRDDGLFDELVKILQEGKLAPPELIDASLEYLDRFPQGGHQYAVQKYLVEAAALDPSFTERLRPRLTQAAYAEYIRIASGPKDVKAPPLNWNDWEYSGWRTMYPDWPIVKLAAEVGAEDLLLEVLKVPPDPATAGVRTIQYLLMDHLWRSPSRDWGAYQKRSEERKHAELRAIGTVIAQTEGKSAHATLRDRAVCVFMKRWEEATSDSKKTPPHDLAVVASDVYAELCRLHAVLGKKEKRAFPPPMKHLDAARLEKAWPLSRETWEIFKREHLATSTPGEEEAAAALATKAQEAMNQGRFAEIHPLCSGLMSTYRHTAFVRSRLKNFEFMLDKFDPAKASPPDHEKKAESMWASVAALAKKGDRGEARIFLGDLLQRYWRTAFVRERQAEIDDLRKQLE
ncbi:MAG: hypothetical protein K8T20_12970 [Planctomycetes bacterium]|nr:hypothetical protein [Planctomycetota bacterium]